MAYRRRKKRNTLRTPPIRFFAVTAAVLALPLLVRFAAAHQELLGQAAVLSAALNMPDSGLDLLEERFREELYRDPEEMETPPADNWDSVPLEEPPTQREEISPGEEDGEGARTETAPTRAPKVPEQYAAPLISEDFSGRDNSSLVRFGAGRIKNETVHEDEVVEDILGGPMSMELRDTPEPQVLLVHTHATESYEKYDNTVYDIRNTWRSTDNNINMVAVGDAMQRKLEENGIGVIHDTTQHDYPSYNGSYERSAVTISRYLEEYPSIRIVLDLHRDAMSRGESIVKPVAVVDGNKAAQIMIISTCDDGTMDVPEWRENLRFAALFQDYMESAFPGLTRPVYFCYRKYNMDLTTGSLLLEIGSNANTLDEAIYSAELAGEALSQLIADHRMA